VRSAAAGGDFHSTPFFGKDIWKNAPPWCIVMHEERQHDEDHAAENP
jgi:hypothetical protein